MGLPARLGASESYRASASREEDARRRPSVYRGRLGGVQDQIALHHLRCFSGDRTLSDSSAMRLDADRLHLSPSDVTAFLACEHLTTLSLAHARGLIDRPDVENEQAELIFRKGLEHERAYLEHLRDDGKTVLEIPDPEGDFDS